MKIKELLTEGYTAYVLTDEAREKLKNIFPPKYSEWIGHHITIKFPAQLSPDMPLGEPVKAEVVGYVEEDGLETLVVAVNGNVKRPDGKTYHITWSLDRQKGKKPVMSNNLIAKKGYAPVGPYSITAHFKYLDF